MVSRPRRLTRRTRPRTKRQRFLSREWPSISTRTTTALTCSISAAPCTCTYAGSKGLSPFSMSTNIFVQSAVQTHLQNLHLADPLIRGRITALDKGYRLDIRMPSRCLPWSESEVVWQPQPESFESGFLHLKELDIALAVSSGVAYRCRLVTRAYPHQLRKTWKRWHCPCIYKFSLKLTSSVEGFDWARFQFNSK